MVCRLSGFQSSGLTMDVRRDGLAMGGGLVGPLASGPATARPFDGDRHYRYLLLRAAFLVIP